LEEEVKTFSVCRRLVALLVLSNGTMHYLMQYVRQRLLLLPAGQLRW